MGLLSSIFGSTDTSSSATQNSTNQQAAADSGSIALGGGSKDNSITIVSTDQGAVDSAFNSNTAISKAAIAGNTAVTELSITSAQESENNFANALSQTYQASTTFASDALTQAIQAEHAVSTQSMNLASAISTQAEGIIGNNTPGQAAVAVSTETKNTQLGIVIIVGIAIVAMVYLGKKN